MRLVGAMLATVLAPVFAVSAQVPPPAQEATAGIILSAEIRRAAAPDLLALLTDPRDDVRARAHRALGRVGLPIHLPRLIEATRDRAAPVRAAAAGALGALDYTLELEAELSARDRAAEALARALDDPAAEVVTAAAVSFGSVARRLDLLDAWLARSGVTAAPEALAAALHARAVFPEATAGALTQFVGAPEPAVRRAAAIALGAGDDPARAPLLDRLLEDGDAEVRILALSALRFAPVRIAVARTERALRFGDWREQCAALGWLAAAWRREPDEPVAADDFAAVLRRSLDRSTAVRRCALDALAARPRLSVAIDRLLEALAEDEPAVRATAAARLAELSEPVRAVALERVGSRDSAGGSDLERAAYLRLRARAGAVDARALQTLVTSSRPWTARAALEELERSDAAAAWAAARAAVRAGEPLVASAAAPVLGRLAALQESPQERAAAADELWARLRDDIDLGARASALEALLRVAPEIVARRASALPEMLPVALRRRAYVLLAGDARAGSGLREDPGPWLEGDAVSAEIDEQVRQALQLQSGPPGVVLSGAGRELSAQLQFDRAPVAASRLVERLRTGPLELEVGPGSGFSLLVGREAGAGDHPVAFEAFAGPLPAGSLVVPVAPGARAELLLLLVQGAYPALAPVGHVADPVRVAGRWPPGTTIVLRLSEPVAASRESHSGGGR